MMINTRGRTGTGQKVQDVVAIHRVTSLEGWLPDTHTEYCSVAKGKG